MNTLGIYFGPQVISVIEARNRQLINNIQISQALISPKVLSEEKVPEEVKMTTLLKDELRKNKVEARDVTVSLSGKDLIVRTFEMPIMPRQELDNAVIFEVKKYIPFKTEDLILDFQWQLDKTIQRNRILFVGIKKEALDKYIYILRESGLRINSIEYSAFSVLRLLKLAGIKEKGIIAIIDIDFAKDDEANFAVLENGFPLFSRDITFAGGYEEAARREEEQSGRIADKLKREIHISLDYYDRKFPGKNISRIFFVANPDYRTDLEGFIKESGLGAQFIDVNKYIGRPIPFSLAFVKGYASALSQISTKIKINLFSAKERTLKKISAERTPLALSVKLIKSHSIAIMAGLFICIAVIMLGVYRLLPSQIGLEIMMNMRPTVSTVSADLSYEKLAAINSTYKTKVEAMDNIIRKRFYLTPQLDALPRIMPKGIWLVNLSFEKKEERAELVLEGMAYLGDNEKESGLVNSFLSRLRQTPAFAKYFKQISLVSKGYSQRKKISITTFRISCRDYTGGVR